MSTSAGQPVGGPAEEARRLVEALGAWATTRLGTADSHIATGSAECQVCPVCQLIAALRGDGPEVLSRLSDAWTAFLGVLIDHGKPGPSPDSGTRADSARAQGPPDVTGLRPVQHIDIR
ncbi:MAG: hypothetical protein M3400_09620 [Actinomycetota bacterium]|nr:hypothetical protein [Actinomycetota bacterium]